MSSDTPSRDFKSALLDAADGLPNEQQLRVMRARLDRRLFTPARPTSRLAFVVVAACSVALGFFLVRWFGPQPKPWLAGFEVTSDTAAQATVTREAALELAPGLEAVDTVRGIHVHAVAASTVRKEAAGVRLVAGRASFEVDKRPPGTEPVRVLVSGGAIEVHGTRFTVVDDGQGSGSVELHEGAIDFRDAQGTLKTLVPGQRLEWPLPQVQPVVPPPPTPPMVTAPPPAPPAQVEVPKEPTPKPSSKPREADWRAFDQRLHGQAVITELGQLRQQGDWAGATRLLQRELNRGAPDTRERLSFELGLLYTRQLQDVPAACEHWQQHRREYPKGRFDAEARSAAESLGCR